MAYIDKTYFNFDLSLVYDGVLGEELDLFIDRYEEEFFRKYFSYEDYKELITGTPVTQRLIDIVDGKEYTGLDGELQRWFGLENPELVSPVAAYVYMQVLGVKNTYTTHVGNAKAQLENALSVDYSQKIHKACLAFNQHMASLVEFLSVEYPDSETFNCLCRYVSFCNRNVLDL